MVIGILRIGVVAPGSQSLKDKRAVVRSLRDRIGAKFKVSVAEVGALDSIQSGELGVACVSTEATHVDQIMARIADFAEANPGDGYISSINTEIMALD